MDTILTYIKWRKDIRFSERTFNDVDALIFAVLAYAEWDDIVNEEGLKLPQACQMFMQSEVRAFDAKRYAYSPEIPKLVDMIQHSSRYKDVVIKKYRSIFDTNEEVQFAAVTFVLKNGTTIVAYRGTDSSILGWREDFYMTYKDVIPSQKYALAYFCEVIEESSKKRILPISMKNNKVYLVGHSKGGNLAMYSAIKAVQYQNQIERVYNFDGPGFLSSFYEENDTTNILNKIKTYLPSVSIIGRLLEHREEAVVIEGYESGLMQHSAFKWQVDLEGFVKAEGLKEESNQYLEYINKVFLSKTKAQKKALIHAIFNSLDNLNIDEITDIADINLKRGLDSIKEWASLSNEDRKFFVDCLAFLISQTKDMLFTKTYKM